MMTKTANKIGLLLLLGISLTSCLSGLVESEGRQSLPIIQDFTLSDNTSDVDDCQDGSGRAFTDVFLNVERTQCLDECPEGFKEASSEEISALIEQEREASELSDEQVTEIQETIDATKGVCIEEIIRPTNAIQFKSNVCGCQNTKAITLNNCSQVCAGKNTNNEELLFGEVVLNESVLLNPSLGSLQNWCSIEIGDGLLNPGCVAELSDGSGKFTLPIKEFTGQSSFTIDIKTLALNQTYVLTLKETTSGATSGSVQIRKIDPDKEVSTRGPLSIHPATMYTCVSRFGPSNAASFFSLDYVKFHFYYSPNNPPPTIPNTSDGRFFCHDMLFGEEDSPLFPRLEEIPQHFAIWNYRDNRFVDTDGNGKEDINDEIQTRLLDEYSISREVKLFSLFKWPNVIATSEGDNNLTILGYFMIPFIDTNTGQGFCPDQSRYNGSDPLFRVLKEYIGVDTEGIYIAEREALAFTDEEGERVEAGQDIIFIRETLLKKIWFYYEDGQHLEPDEITSTSKRIMFYWPADINDPYVRKSTQDIYTIRAASEIGTGNDEKDLQTVVRPPDKRYGCVPSIGDVTTNPIINN